MKIRLLNINIILCSSLLSFQALAEPKDQEILCKERSGTFRKGYCVCEHKDPVTQSITQTIIIPLRESCEESFLIETHKKLISQLEALTGGAADCALINSSQADSNHSVTESRQDPRPSPLSLQLSVPVESETQLFIATIEKKIRFAHISGGWKSDLVSGIDLVKLETYSRTDGHAAQMFRFLKSMAVNADKKLKIYENIPREKVKALLKKVQINADLTAEEQSVLVKAKKAWIDLLTQEGAYIQLRDVFSSSRNSQFSEDIFKSNVGLKHLKQLAEVQSPKLDEALNADMLGQRKAELDKLKTAAGGPKEPLHVLVQGGGIHGLHAAVQQFLIGNNVHLVNDRGEDYLRKQILGMDPKLTARLRYILGSKFDRVFLGAVWKAGKRDGTQNELTNTHEAHLHNYDGDLSAEATTRTLEDALKQRLAEVSSLSSSDAGSGLKLDYNLKLDRIAPPISGADSSSTQKFIAHLSGTKVTGKSDRGAAFDRSEETKNEPVDLVILAGGAGDRTRDQYLGPTVRKTEPIIYSVGTWNKQNPSGNSPSPQKTLEIFANHAMSGHVSARLSMNELSQNLRGEKFDEYIESEHFPAELRDKYRGLIARIEREAPLVVRQPPGTNSPKEVKEWEVRKFENNRTVYFGLQTPKIIQDLRNDLGSLSKAKGKTPAERESIALAMNEVDRKWFHATIKGFVAEKERVDLELKLDSEPLNHTVFPLSQSVPEKSVKVLKGRNGQNLVLAVVGDSNVSPHFFSGSGATTGYVSILDLTEETKKYNHGEIGIEQLVRNVQAQDLQTQTYSLGRGSQWLKPLSQEQQNESARQNAISVLDAQVARDQIELEAERGTGVQVSQETRGTEGSRRLSPIQASKVPPSNIPGATLKRTPDGNYEASFQGGGQAQFSVGPSGHLVVKSASPSGAPEEYLTLQDLYMNRVAGVTASSD